MSTNGVCAHPRPTDHPMVGKRTTARIEILAFGIPRPHHATNSALRAVRALTELFILSTKDSNPQALNRTHLWIHWHNHTCCQLSEICVHQSNSENFRNIVEARFWRRSSCGADRQTSPKPTQIGRRAPCRKAAGQWMSCARSTGIRTPERWRVVVAGEAIKRRRFVAPTSCAAIEPPALVSSH
jgi:hypothetical protein